MTTTLTPDTETDLAFARRSADYLALHGCTDLQIRETLMSEFDLDIAAADSAINRTKGRTFTPRAETLRRAGTLKRGSSTDRAAFESGDLTAAA